MDIDQCMINTIENWRKFERVDMGLNVAFLSTALGIILIFVDIKQTGISMLLAGYAIIVWCSVATNFYCIKQFSNFNDLYDLYKKK